MQSSTHSLPLVKYDKQQNNIVLSVPTISTASTSPDVPSVATPPSIYAISPYTLRLACTCAMCIDEHTGEKRLKPEKVPRNIHPLGIQPRGNYAVAIHWSDGHASSIYPYTAIMQLANPAK